MFYIPSKKKREKETPAPLPSLHNSLTAYSNSQLRRSIAATATAFLQQLQQEEQVLYRQFIFTRGEHFRFGPVFTQKTNQTNLFIHF